MKKLTGLLLLLLLYSCEPPVTFEEPQPAGAAKLNRFPAKLLGNYKSITGNAALVISRQYIIRVYNEALRLHKNELNSTLTLKDHQLTDQETGNRYKAELYGDTILVAFTATDTIFALSSENVLTKNQGSYFLNTAYGENRWGVEKLNIHKSLLTIHSVTLSTDLTKLRELAVPEMNAAQTFKPTRRQFRDFVKMDGFGHEECFIKTPR